MNPIIIIGNGIAGTTTARHIRKRSDVPVVLVSDESPYFFSRTALMYVYMGHMRLEDIQPYANDFWEKNRIDRIHDRVTSIDFETCTLMLKSQKQLRYSKLVIATGSSPRMPAIEGIHLNGVQGLYHLDDLSRLEKRTHPPGQGVKKAVVVGGGLIGVELAEMLHSRGIHVTLLIRDDRYWAAALPDQEARLIAQHLTTHGIELRFNETLVKLEGTDQQLSAVYTDSGERLECEFCGLTIGVQPNVAFLASTPLELDRGILVDQYLQTNIPNVFAAGDCVQMRQPLAGRKAIEPVWYTGRMMGEVLGATLAGNPTEYRPGVWFNSAKFFDIEYQVYGAISGDVSEPLSHYWSPGNGRQCMRFAFDDQFVFKGVHALGMRLRHETIDRWLQQSKPMKEVLQRWHEANFDSEFSKRYETEIIHSWNKRFHTELKPFRKRRFSFFK